MFHILWSIVVGFVIGLLARALVPGADVMGFWMTTGLGVGGSIVGGLVGRLFDRPRDGAMFHPAGVVMSLIGAIGLLVVWKMMH
jgi:uncharacterized membrane protein YeaQ/YmgE (transglycosylase-associated protein family)